MDPAGPAVPELGDLHPGGGAPDPAETDPAGRARGLVLVTVDTLRADHVAAYGGPVPTPALDALARQGVLLEHACTPVPSTGPVSTTFLASS